MIAFVLLGLAAFLKQQLGDTGAVAAWGSPVAPIGGLPRTSADVLPGDNAGRDPQDPYTGYTSWASSSIPPGGFARQDTELLLNPSQTNRVLSMASEPRAALPVSPSLTGRRL